jgi:hypothetical protein
LWIEKSFLGGCECEIKSDLVSVEKILKAAEPNAMWLSVNQSDYDAVEVLNHVNINVDGAI